MAKKQLIMEKALELFAENGFQSTSIQQITDRCNISKGSFYLHFKSKDELIFELINHFLTEFITDIEQSVSDKQSNETLLFNYLYISFSTIEKNAHFAKLFIKEQMATINPEIFKRLEEYDALLNHILLSIVERQYSQTNPKMHADLAFMVKGFTKSYTELFLFNDMPVDIPALCKMLVERTTILAEHAKTPFLTPEYLYGVREKLSPSKEDIINLIKIKTTEIAEDEVIYESLQLLLEDLISPNLHKAILYGLLKNIRENSHCKWVAYLYEIYLKNQAEDD